MALTTPAQAAELLRAHGASAWLLRHHELVLEATDALVGELSAWARFDASLVRLGAALHDAGKLFHPEETRAPGHAHEAAGEAWLLSLGVPPRLAQICVTHARWDEHRASLEDRLVALADKLWKGKRDEALERALVTELAKQTGLDPWECFERFDALCERIASGGDERLARSDV